MGVKWNRIVMLFISTLSFGMEQTPLNLALFVSSDAKHLQAVLDESIPNCIPRIVISNLPTAPGITLAKERGIDTKVLIKEKISFAREKDPERWDQEDAQIRKKYCACIMTCLQEYDITPQNGLLACARFIVILAPNIVQKFKGRIINIHPSLNPAFPGLYPVTQAYEYGAKLTGVTAHFIDEGLDTGQIIKQEAVTIEDNDTLDDVREKCSAAGCRIFTKAIRLFAEGRLCIEGRKIKVLSPIASSSNSNSSSDYSD